MIHIKYRESGMPPEQMWNTFFSPLESLQAMGVNKNTRILVEIGCGYGTFLIPAAKLVRGRVVGIDIDAECIKICKTKLIEEKINNMDLIHDDISIMDVSQFKNKYNNEIDYVGLFNILHCEEPIQLLIKVREVLDHNGCVGIIHWKYEKTPRGPSMEIRPTPDKIIEWAEAANLRLQKHIELPPYHFGLLFTKS